MTSFAERQLAQRDPGALSPVAQPEPTPSKSFAEQAEDRAKERAQLTMQRFRDTGAEQAITAAQRADRAPELLGTEAPEELFLLPEGELTKAFVAAEASVKARGLNPRIARWVTDQPVNAVLANQYGEELGMAQSVFNSLARGSSYLGLKAYSLVLGREAAERRLNTAEDALADTDRTLGEIVEAVRDEDAQMGDGGDDAEVTIGENLQRLWQNFNRAITPSGDLVEAKNRYDRRGTSTPAEVDNLREAFVSAGVEDARWRELIDNTFERDVRSKRVSAKIEQEDTFWGKVTALTSDPVDMAAFMAGIVLESAPTMVAGAATTLVTRNPTLGASVMGAGSALYDSAHSYDEIAKAAGFDLSTEEGLRAFVSSPAARAYVNDRSFARSVVIGAMDFASGGVASRQLATNPFVEVLVQGGVQSFMGGAGELFGQLGADQEVDLFEVLLEGLAEFVTAPVEVFGVGGQALTTEARRRVDARGARQFFDALGAAAENSEMRAKVPKKYREALAALTENGPVEKVQIDGAGLEQLLQSGRLTPEQIAAVVPSLDVEAIRQAVEGGQDLEMSTADFAAYVVGSDIDAAFREHMRINGSMTSAELKLAEAAQQDMAVAIKEVEAGVRKLGDTLDAERARLEEELQTAGRTPAVAKAEATQLVTFASVMAQRQKVPVEKFLADHPLPRLFARYENDPAEIAVDDLTTVRGLDTPEGLLIERAAQAAGLTETATNEELAEAVRDYAGVRSPTQVPETPEAARTRLEAGAALQNRTLNQSSENIFENPLPVTPTGGKNGTTLTNQDIARAFTDWLIATEGGKRDTKDPAVRAAIVDDMEREIRYQLRTSADSGSDWYAADILRAFEYAVRIFPELEIDPANPREGETKRNLFLVVAALLSPQNNPVNNWEDATDAFARYLRTGRFEDVKPSRRKRTADEIKKMGKGEPGEQLLPAKYGVSSGTSLPLLQFLIDTRGEIGAIEWLVTKKTAKEMGEMRRASGIFKDGNQDRKWQDFLPKDVKTNDVMLGMAMYGPKVSDFMLNATGIDPDAVTVDLWLMRTFNRHRGMLLDVGEKLLAEGGLYDQPNRGDREALDEMVTELGRRFNRNPSTIQALLWYYEQRLWTAHGARSDSRNFLQGAQRSAEKRGVGDDARASGPAGQAGQGADQMVARSEEPVRPDDLFAPGGVKPDFWGRPGWAALTADDSTIENERVRTRRNREEEARLIAELDARGIQYRPVTGMYGGDPERSFIILADEATAEELGRKFMQDSVLTRDGFVYTRGAPRPNTRPTGRLLTGQAALDAGFYSRMDDGRVFALEMDFDNTGPGKPTTPVGMRELPERPQLPVDADGMATLYHWSDEKRDRIDPAKAGSGPLKNAVNRGSEVAFWGINPRSNLRQPGTGYVPEPGLGAVIHTARVDAKKLYPWFEDPDGLRPTEGTAGQRDAAYTKAIREAGYLGTYVTEDGTGRAPNGNVATLFEVIEADVYDGTLESIYTPEEIAMPLSGTPEEQLAQLAALTEENRPIVAQIMAQIDERFGTVSKDNVKAPENVLTKSTRPSILTKKPWFTMAHIRDSYRLKTPLKDFRDLPAVMEVLQESGVAIVKSDTAKFMEPAEWGWRIIAFDLRMPNGQLVEYYLPMVELEEAKDAGHLLFEKWRNLAPGELTKKAADYARDLKASRDLYQSAFDAALSRLGIDMPAAEAAFAKVVASLSDAQLQSLSTSDGSGMSSSVSGADFQTPSYVLTQNPPPKNSTAPSVSLATSAENIGGTSSDVGDGGTVDDEAAPVNYALPDLEKASPGRVEGVRELATEYMRSVGLPVRHQASYVRVDTTRAKLIAELYERAEDRPGDPEVRAAYDALAKETIAQYEALKALGYTFEWIVGEDPYASPADAIRDMQENKHLWVFPTTEGFGTLTVASDQNPLLQLTDEVIDGRQAMVNDLFRIVHDVFGHGSEGAAFGARGEENAWQAHVRMFSPLAARAMTAETRGQNSWVNYGPYGEQNRANPKDTIFADQKTTLLPEWVSQVGQADDMPLDANGNPAPAMVIPPEFPPRGTELFQSAQPESDSMSEFKAWFGDSKVVDENGQAKVVYHGSEKAGFFSFAPPREGRTEGAIYFAGDVRLASTYAGTTREVQPPLSAKALYGMGLYEIRQDPDGVWRGIDDEGIDSYEGSSFDMVLEQMQGNIDALNRDGKQPGIYHVYLKIEDPLVIEADGAHWSRIPTGSIFRVTNSDGDVIGYIDEHETVAEEFPGETDYEVEEVDTNDEMDLFDVPDRFFETTDSLAHIAREGGYDGLIIKNVYDFGRHASAGVGGDVYVVFDGQQVKSIHNSGAFNPADPNIYRQGKRGSFTPNARGRAPLIQLFEKANLSTVLHESGHYFLHTYQQLIASGTADASIVADYERLKNWWRTNAEAVAKDAGAPVTAAHIDLYLTKGTVGDARLDTAIWVGMHEQFARAYEAYLFEGKAPAPELRTLFDTFSSWLIAIYKRVTRLNVKMDDEVRGVFDRMLATDEQIAKAKVESGHIEMIASSAEELGVSEAEYARIVELSSEAEEEARRTLLAEVMKPLLEEQKARRDARREAVEKEVRAELVKKPGHRVVQWLGNEKWIDGDQPVDVPEADGFRMDRQMLIDQYGRDVVDKLPRGRAPLWKSGTNVAADEVATYFGFPSGDAMIAALQALPRLEDAVKAEVERRLAMEAEDPMVTGEIAEKALAAISGERRGDLIVAELRAIGKNATRKTQTSKSAARAAARKRIAMTPVREAVNYRGFLGAMQRAAQRAQEALAKGDFDTAYNEKRKELLNHALYMEAREASETVAKAERKVARLKKKSTRQNIDGDYLEAIDEIMDRYDFRRTTRETERRRGALQRYVEMMTNAGRANELAIPQKLLDQAQRQPYKTMPYNELKGVLDALANIEHTGRRKKKLIDAKEQRDLDQAVADALADARQNIKGKPPARTRTGDSRFASGLRHYANLLLNADTLLREADGFTLGKMYDLIKRPIDEAGNAAQVMRVEASAKLDTLYSRYSPRERREMAVRRDHPALRTPKDRAAQFSKWDLISMALNMGNEQNLDRLMDKDNGYGLTAQQVEYVKAQLDGRDWEFVKETWALLESYWPLLAAREKRQTGVVPEKVAPVEVETPYGTLTGGYYPISYDARLNSIVAADQIADLQVNMMAGRFGKAQTKHGHVKERAAGSGGRALEIGMHVLHGHLAQVTHDLAYSEAVNNAWRILQHPEIVAFYESNGRAMDRQSLELWVQDVATGNVIGGGWAGGMAVKLKNNFTLSKLAFNLGTVALQPTGVVQSMVVVGKASFLKAAGQYMQNIPRWQALILERSAFMQERQTTFQRDIYDLMGDTTQSPLDSRYAELQRGVGRTGFWLMQKVQFYTADMPTWIAGYNNALVAGKTDAEAVLEADSMVRRAQASGLMADRSAFERGTLSRDTRQNGFVRLFTALGSYMFAKGNIAYERVNKGRRQISEAESKLQVLGAVLDTMHDMVMLFAYEALILAVLRGQLPDDDDDDGLGDDYAKWLAGETVYGIMGTMPILRDVVGGIRGFEAGGSYGSISATLGAALQQIGQGELDAALLKSLSNVAGVATGIPSAQVNRVIESMWLAGSGEDVSVLEHLGLQIGRRIEE